MSYLIGSEPQVFRKILQKFKNFLFDCDGVLWHGNVPIKGAVDVVSQLHKFDKRVLYITNNSTKTREQLLEKLSSLGFAATKNDVFGTAYTSALYLKNECKVQGKVYVVGNPAMGKEMGDLGINHFGIGPDNSINELSHADIAKCKLEKDVEAVLVGFDGYFSYSKLVKAASYLRNPKCLYVATNLDDRLPIDDAQHVIPGAGCLVSAVSTAAGKPPDVWCGKPGIHMFKCIQNELKLDPEKSMMIGDRMNTDILFGKRNNLKTLLVLTGCDSRDSIEKAAKSDDCQLKEQLPDYCMDSIGLWSSMFEEP